MKNLKKTLAVVLAFVMVLSMSAISTLAFSDVAAGTVVSEAVGILSNLKILAGFEDGTFRPDETVTRAQMAAIICRTLGYEEQAQSSMGSTVFNDVAGDHWAAGYINVAQAQGIINGYGNGNFGPEDQVTYEQAVKMIVSALGYDLVAQTKGGYPTGYLAVASSEGITKSANGKVGDAAKRSAIAVLVYNSLEVRLMDQSSWTSNNENEYKKTNDTILSKYLEVNKWEGVVTATALTAVAGGTYDAEAEKAIKISGDYKVYADGKLTPAGEKGITANSELVDADQLIGKSVVAYIGEDENGADTVFAIAESKKGNEITTISAIDLVEADDEEWDIAGQISYRKSGSSRVYDLDLDKEVKVYNNFKAVDLDANTTEELAEKLPYGGSIQFISNDSDEDIEYILITAYDEAAAVVKEVAVEDGVYSFETFTGSVEEVDTTDEEALTIVMIDGALATVADLKANYTVSTVEIATGLVALYASSKTVTGAVDSYSDDDNTVTIAGADYDLVGLVASELKDEEGIFFLNVDGQIVWNETEATGAAKYALVLAVSYEQGINDAYVAQVVAADGTVAEYEFANKVKYGKLSGAEAVAKAIANNIAGTDSLGTVKLAEANATKAIYDITIKNGEISKVADVSVSGKVTNKGYDEVDMSYGSLSFEESTVVFALKATQTAGADTEDKKDDKFEILEDGVAIGAIADYFADGEGQKFELYGVSAKETDATVAAVIGFGLKTTVAKDGAAVIVTGKKTVTYNDDDATYITGIQAGKEVAYTIYSEDAYSSTIAPEALLKGDIILVGAANAEGVVSDFETLFLRDARDLNGDTDTTDDKEGGNVLLASYDSEDEIYYIVGELAADPKPTATKFYFAKEKFTVVDNKELGYDNADGITMKSSANYTVVDYTESVKYPEFAKKSAGTGVFGSVSKYQSYVFVRYYEGKVVEVVAYRTNVPAPKGEGK